MFPSACSDQPVQGGVDPRPHRMHISRVAHDLRDNGGFAVVG